MNSQERSIELPAQGARRATGEGSKHGWQTPQRFSARQKTDVVLRLLRGEPLALVSRDLGIPAARLTTWREAFLAAGQEARKTPPLESRDREIGRLRAKLGESTMAMELWREKIGRLETSRPFPPRRARGTQSMIFARQCRIRPGSPRCSLVVFNAASMPSRNFSLTLSGGWQSFWIAKR